LLSSNRAKQACYGGEFRRAGRSLHIHPTAFTGQKNLDDFAKLHELLMKKGGAPA
jgi:hypothetical protein